jgi:hypothetical protein
VVRVGNIKADADAAGADKALRVGVEMLSP